LIGVKQFGFFRFQLLKAGIDLVSAGFGFFTSFFGSFVAGGCQVSLTVDLLKQVIRVQFSRINFLAGSSNDGGVETQSVSNGERIGTPRQADHKAVGRTKRFEVKLQAGIGDTFGGVSVSLELGVVSGNDGGDAALEHKVQDGARQGGAFLGIRASAKFVQQNE